MAGQEESWWSVRMVVELPADERLPDSQLGFPKFEDRIILVRAADDQEARQKGTDFAADYEKTSSWIVRKIVEVQEIADADLKEGTEIYSAFIDREWADVLMKGGTSPLAEWKKLNPGKDPGDATVQEIVDAWDNRDS
jgi:hypothetical protein